MGKRIRGNLFLIHHIKQLSERVRPTRSSRLTRIKESQTLSTDITIMLRDTATLREQSGRSSTIQDEVPPSQRLTSETPTSTKRRPSTSLPLKDSTPDSTSTVELRLNLQQETFSPSKRSPKVQSCATSRRRLVTRELSVELLDAMLPSQVTPRMVLRLELDSHQVLVEH